jgi:hypothetical protein
MRQMWESMVAEPRETVDKHFNGIITELLSSMGGRQFRERQASCLALIDLLQSRNYSQVWPLPLSCIIARVVTIMYRWVPSWSNYGSVCIVYWMMLMNPSEK